MESSSSSLELVDTFPFDTSGNEIYRAKLEWLPADDPSQIEYQSSGYLGTFASVSSVTKVCHITPVATYDETGLEVTGFEARFFNLERTYLHQFVYQNDSLHIEHNRFIEDWNNAGGLKYAPLRGKPGFYAAGSAAIVRITADSLFMWDKPSTACWADQMLQEPAYTQKIDCSTVRIPSLDLVISQQGATWAFPGETCSFQPQSDIQDSSQCQAYVGKCNDFFACLHRNYNSTFEPIPCREGFNYHPWIENSYDQICVNFESPTYFSPTYGL